MEIFGWVIVAIIIGVPLLGIVLYNSLVSLRNQVKNAWRQIDVQLKRRHDPVSYTHLTLPTRSCQCRSRWSPDR